MTPTQAEAEAVAQAKVQWGAGPWQDEPDRVEFEHAGFPCLIRRTEFGALCGYVAMPPGHPWHGQHYDNRGLPEAHGGLTFAGECHGPICHEPKWGEPADVWWLGFDCAHAWDLTPGLRALLRHAKDKIYGDFDSPFHEIFHKLEALQQSMPAAAWPTETYKDIAYVRAQCEAIAEQAVIWVPGAQADVGQGLAAGRRQRRLPHPARRARRPQIRPLGHGRGGQRVQAVGLPGVPGLQLGRQRPRRTEAHQTGQTLPGQIQLQVGVNDGAVRRAARAQGRSVRWLVGWPSGSGWLRAWRRCTVRFAAGRSSRENRLNRSSMGPTTPPPR